MVILMKYKLVGIFTLIAFMCLFNFVYAKDKAFPLIGKVIYLDPGHGGPDSGAYYKDIEEASLNLEISQKIMGVLKEEGAVVYLTRYGDYDLAVNNAWNRKRSDLSRRANIINNSNCDLYLSIHLNANESTSQSGAEAYYDTINPENKKIAEIFQETFKRELGSTRDYKENSTKYLQRRITRPGVLLEVGFLSNSSERYLLNTDTYQYKIAQTVAAAVNKYFSS